MRNHRTSDGHNVGYRLLNSMPSLNDVDELLSLVRAALGYVRPWGGAIGASGAARAELGYVYPDGDMVVHLLARGRRGDPGASRATAVRALCGALWRFLRGDADGEGDPSLGLQVWGSARRDAERAQAMKLLLRERWGGEPVDLFVVNARLETPVHCAVRGRSAAVLDVMLRHEGVGACLRAEDAQGLIPLDIAAAVGEWDLVKLLLQAARRVGGPRGSGWKGSEARVAAVIGPALKLADGKGKGKRSGVILDEAWNAFSALLSRAVYGNAEREMQALQSTRVKALTRTETLGDDAAIHSKRRTEIRRLAAVAGLSEAKAQQQLETEQWDLEKAFYAVSHRRGVTGQGAAPGGDAGAGPPGAGEGATCIVCWDDLEGDAVPFALECGHAACQGCWTKFMEVRISEGNTRAIKCLHPECDALVPEGPVLRLLPKKLQKKFEAMAAAKFIDASADKKWCPNPQCCRPVVINAQAGAEDCASDALEARRALDVTCEECSTQFCWHCGQEPHEPASCKGVATWKSLHDLVRNEETSAAESWIQQHTQACPSCGANIQRTAGCNHMICSACRHNFCWVCRRPWEEHGARTGGFYSCNLYTEGGAEASSSAAGAAGRGPEGQLNWLTQKRFLFYLRKFNSHDVASDDLDPALRRLLGLGRGFLDKPEADAFGRALVAARDAIVFARKTLKYSYVHSYFQEWGQHRRYLELLQGRMEILAEALSGIFFLPRRNHAGDLVPHLTVGTAHFYHAASLWDRRQGVARLTQALNLYTNQLVRGVRSGVLSQEAAKQPPGGGANLDFRGTSLGTSLLDLAAQGARAALSFKGGGA